MRIRRNLVPLVYVLPACLLMLVFVIAPIILSVVMSLFKIEALNAEWGFIGIRNYLFAFRENEFLSSLGRTLGFGLFSVVSSLVLGLLLALLVAGDKHLNFYRYIFYVPGVVSAVTMGMLWQQMLEPTKFGMLNSLLMNVFGVEKPIFWLNMEEYTWMVVLGIGLIGCGGGQTLIIFTTAINDISPDIKEAATLDGVNNWQMTRYITLPLISPVISSWMVLSIIGSLKSFEFIYALTAGGPNKTTQTLAILLFDGSGSAVLGYGYTSAMGVLMSVVVLAFTGAYLGIKKLLSKSEEM